KWEGRDSKKPESLTPPTIEIHITCSGCHFCVPLLSRSLYMGQEPQTQEKTAWTLRLACGGQRHAAGSNASHHLAKLAKKYGNVYQIRLGCSDIVVLNGDKAIRPALIQHSTEFAGRPNFISFQSVSGGKSMTFTNYSKQWKMHRKIAQSTIRAFSSANSQTKKAFEQQIVAEATELVEIFLKHSTEGQYFNPAHELTVAAANVICFRALLQNVDKFGQTVGAGSLVDVMPWLQSFPNPVRSIFKNFKDLNRDFFMFVRNKVEEHRETFDPEVTRDMSDAIIGVIDKADSDNGLTTDHTEGTVSDLIGAGLDTVSTALHWILLLLQVTFNVTIEGQFIPKDTVVFINQWSINHDPLSERTPYLNPSRFLDENGSLDKDITNSVMIFSAGKRRCIGDQIAKVEIFLFFAILLHQCTFEKCPTQDLSLDCSYGLTLKPLDYKICAKLRGELVKNQ
uniref:Cytochrome P450, family 1, subfamily C, polypeptide 2 n=1 Tax=Sphaeramia orbicularis TaxID=375764 RepID=A0A673CBW0_9TELE